MRFGFVLLLLVTPWAVSAQDYSTPYGAWRGQAQYQVSVQSVPDPAAHAVSPLVIEIDTAGKLKGSSPENGCQLLGIARPSPVPTLLNLDVTISGCRYAGLNRRYSGTFGLYTQRKYASLD